MGNKGSSVASAATINTLETAWLLRESRQYIYDEQANEWIPLSAQPGITTKAKDFDNDIVNLNPTPQPIGSGEIIAVLIKAETTNKEDAYIGTSGKADVTKGYPLRPGETVALKTDNLNKIHASGAVGDKIRYIAIVG